MGNLYAFEWKKLFRHRSFLFFSLALLLGNLFTLFQYEKNKDYYMYFYQLKEEWQEYVNGDYTVPNAEYYQGFVTEAEDYAASYDDFLKQIPEQAERLAQTANYQDHNTYLYRNLVKTVFDYSALSSEDIKADPGIAVRELASYDYGIYFQLVFLFGLSYFVVSQERRKGLFLLTKGTRKGHVPLAAAKLLTILSAGVLYSALQECGTFSLLAYLYGFGDISRHIQSVSIFRDCTATITVAGALVILFMVRIFIGMLCAALIACLTIGIRREGIALIVYSCLIGIEMFLNHSVEVSGSLNIVKCINVFFTWNMKNLFGIYLNLNVFGYPVGKTAAALAVGTVFICILIFVGLYRFSKGCQISTGSLLEDIQEKIAEKTSFQWHHTSLLWFEFRKVFFQQKRGYLLVGILIWCAFCVRDTVKPIFYDDPEEGEYHRILTEISGPVTSESLDYISKQREELDEMYEELGKLSKETGQEARIKEEMLLHELKIRDGGTAAVENQRDMLKEKPRDIFDKYWVDEKNYISTFYDYQYDLAAFLVGTIVLVLWMSGIETSDEGKGLYPLLYATKAGKDWIRRKKKYVCIIGMFWCMVCVLVPQILRYYRIDHFQNIRQQLSDFTLVGWKESLSVGSFIILIFLAKMILFMMVCSLLLKLVRRVHNAVIVIGIGVCCIGIAVLLLWYFHMDITIFFARMLSVW